MQTITLADAQARLPEVIDSLVAEKEIAITRDDEIVAVILPKQSNGSSSIAQAGQQLVREREPRTAPRNVLGMKTFSVGKVLKPHFDRAEVWDEMSSRKE